MAYNIKTIRQEFKDKGIFYTDSKLAEIMKSYVDRPISEVYDPTCGDGALLSVFAPEVKKYGQELNADQLEVAASRLENFEGACGDTLQHPAFEGKKFECIMANPPFSIKWEQRPDDPRFTPAPAVAPKSKADYAFLMHILHHLKEDGIAVTLNFPGILYRGNAEGKIRQWMIEQNYIDRVVMIPKGYFVDTSIATAMVILKKNKTTTNITYEDRELEKEVVLTLEQVRENGYNLSGYIHREEEREEIDPEALEDGEQELFLSMLQKRLELIQLTASIGAEDKLQRFISNLERVVEPFKAGAQL